MNKKTIIQITMLVLLAAAAAGVYLFPDEAGKALGFVTRFFEERLAEPQAPPPNAAERRPAAGAPAGRRVRPSAAAIPTHPAKGQVRGAPFVVDGARIENAVLTLFQGKDGSAEMLLTIAPVGMTWEAPAGTTIKVAEKAAGAPRVQLSWKEEGKLRHEQFGENYTLQLEFETEKNGKLPGRISLVLPDEGRSTVAGTFEAEIRGFRIVNGKPDLASDSVGTFEFLALRELLKDDPDKAVKDIVFRDGRLAPADDVMPATGYIEMEYRVGDGAPAGRRFQFVKDKGEWQILRALRTNEIDAAHPLAAPSPKKASAALFYYLAARRLEAEIQKKHPGRGVHGVEFTERHSDKHKVAVTEVSYRLGVDEKPLRIVYLFRLKPGGWTLERELGAREKLNINTGKIEKR